MRRGFPTLLVMPETQEFEWDVHSHPNRDDWFDAMLEAGWCRDFDSVGTVHPDGTVTFRFYFIGPDPGHQPAG